MNRSDITMFTANVNSLFPSIPLPLVSSLLHDVFTLITPSSSQISWLSSLSDLLLNNNYFTFNDKLFLQTSGAPMGSPLSSSLAEIIMQNLEVSILPHFKEFFTIHWFRYVDDIFIMTNASMDTIQTILDRMTTHTPQITFTLQSENNNQLAFLDVLITREGSHFQTQVYHKPTANTAIIPATSMTIRPQKLAAFKTFFARALSISSKPEYMHREIQHIFNIAKNHGFQKEQIARIWHHTKNTLQTQLSPTHALFPFLGSVTYVPGISERISRWLFRKGFRIATSPCPNIHQATRSDKPLPPPPLQQSGVYCIPIILADGTTSSYIGSTIRCLDIRLREHLKACSERNVYSVLAQTTMSGGQPIWKDATIIGTARNTSLLRWKEALFIHSHHTVNQPSVQLNSTLIQATGIKSLSLHCPG